MHTVIKSVLQSGAAELLEAMFSPYQAIFSSHVFSHATKNLFGQAAKTVVSIRQIHFHLQFNTES
jgi:hypothetical protein